MFTPVETTIGALLLHQATSNLLYQNGSILGLSGLLRGLMAAPTVEIVGFFAGMAASYPLLRSLVPELITRYPSVSLTPQSVIFTTSVAALIGWGTKVHKVDSIGRTQKLIWDRHRMAARLDTCCAGFRVSADVLQ